MLVLQRMVFVISSMCWHTLNRNCTLSHNSRAHNKRQKGPKKTNTSVLFIQPQRTAHCVWAPACKWEIEKGDSCEVVKKFHYMRKCRNSSVFHVSGRCSSQKSYRYNLWDRLSAVIIIYGWNLFHVIMKYGGFVRNDMPIINLLLAVAYLFSSASALFFDGVFAS